MLKKMSVLFTFEQTCLTFFGHGDGGLSTETKVSLFQCHTHEPTDLHLRLSLKGIPGLFQASL